MVVYVIQSFIEQILTMLQNKGYILERIDEVWLQIHIAVPAT